MSYSSRVAAQEEAEDAAREREAARARCPKAAALYEAVLALGRPELWQLEMSLGDMVQNGEEVTPDSEAYARAQMWEVAGEQAVEVPGLPQEADGRAMQQMPHSAAVVPQEREPKAMASMDDVYGGNTLKAEELPENFRAVLAVESVSVQEFEGRDGKGVERKLVLRFLGRAKGLALNVTNANMMAEIAKSRDYDHWTGHQVLLYRTTTDYQGKRVPALRLDHATPFQAPTARPVASAPRPAAPPPPPPQAEPFVATDDDVPF